MTYVCGRCGHSFDPEDAATVTETLDVIDGKPYREQRQACPECGSTDLATYARCLSCGDHHEPDELYGGTICGKCLDRYAKNRRLLQMYVEDDPHKYAEFIAELLDKGDTDDE